MRERHCLNLPCYDAINLAPFSTCALCCFYTFRQKFDERQKFVEETRARAIRNRRSPNDDRQRRGSGQKARRRR